MINLHHQVFGRKAIVKNEGLILDLPFQNSFVDATGKNTMIAGGASNLPTFTLEGGEYAATFNGSQSLKTNANFNINFTYYRYYRFFLFLTSCLHVLNKYTCSIPSPFQWGFIFHRI